MPLAVNGMKICSNPNCSHGGAPQPVSNFSKDNKRADKLTPQCKDCKRMQDKKNYENNTATIKLRNHTYDSTHRAQRKEYEESPAEYDTYFKKIFLYEECQRDPKHPELLQVKCKHCGNFFNPTNRQIQSRLTSINGTQKDRTHGDHNLYCSDKCKKACPIFRKKIYPNGSQITHINLRPLQGELRELVLERDNYTCCKCGKSREENPDIVLICHHIDPVASNPIESADIDNCATFCQECHNWLHKNIPGCSTAELRKCKSKKTN